MTTHKPTVPAGAGWNHWTICTTCQRRVHRVWTGRSGNYWRHYASRERYPSRD